MSHIRGQDDRNPPNLSAGEEADKLCVDRRGFNPCQQGKTSLV